MNMKITEIEAPFGVPYLSPARRPFEPETAVS